MSFSIRVVSRIATMTLAAAVIAAPAGAGVDAVTFEFAVDGAGTTFNPEGTDIGNGVMNFKGELNDVNFSLSWDLNTKADPFVSGNIVVTNTSFFTQVFSFTVIVPVAPAVLPSSLVGGSVAGSLSTDGDGGEVASVGPGGFIWSALIDGVDALGGNGSKLLGPDFLVGKAGFGTVGIGPESFGADFGIPSAAGPAVNDTIAINLTFSLTPGDSVAFTSVFVVEAIPGPAGLALLGIAGLVSGRRRRA